MSLYEVRQLPAPAGSASEPSVAFLGDTNTGLYSPGADQLAISTGGIERVRTDSSGRLLVGTSTARSNFFGSTTLYSPGFQLEGATDQNRIVSIVGSAATGAAGILALGSQKSGSVGGNTAVTSGGELGIVSFQGNDGQKFVQAAHITVQVDGTPGLNDMPGRLVFGTTADGAAAPTEQLRISSAGTVIYNQPAPAAVDTSATLTVANLTAKIITSTTAAAVTMTLPTGTNMDAGFSGLYNNMAFEWTVINTGGTNAVTVAANTAHTVVGSGTVAASGSGRFLSRRTAGTTWVTYRLAT